MDPQKDANTGSDNFSAVCILKKLQFIFLFCLLNKSLLLVRKDVCQKSSFDYNSLAKKKRSSGDGGGDSSSCGEHQPARGGEGNCGYGVDEGGRGGAGEREKADCHGEHNQALKLKYFRKYIIGKLYR